MKAIAIFLGTFIFLGYISFIKSVYYRFKLSNSMIRIVPAKRKYTSKYIYVIALTVFIFVHRLYKYIVYLKENNIAHANSNLYWIIISGISCVYFILIILNSKYVYVTETMILFPDCVRKSSDYRYRIIENTLEFRPVKPPKKIETYVIEEKKELLTDVLAKNYQTIED